MFGDRTVSVAVDDSGNTNGRPRTRWAGRQHLLPAWREGQSNAQLVERTVRIAHELNREVATPTQTRQMLGLSQTPTSYF